MRARTVWVGGPAGPTLPTPEDIASLPLNAFGELNSDVTVSIRVSGYPGIRGVKLGYLGIASFFGNSSFPAQRVEVAQACTLGRANFRFPFCKGAPSHGSGTCMISEAAAQSRVGRREPKVFG